MALDAGPAWSVLLRGPSLPARGAELALPSGGATTLGDLRALAASAARLNLASLSLRTGFPPRSLEGPDDAAVSDAGVADRASLLCLGETAEGEAHSDDPVTHPLPQSLLGRGAPTSAAKGKPKSRRGSFAGASHTLGGGAVSAAATAAAAAAASSPAAAPRPAAGGWVDDAAALASAGPLAAALAAAGCAPDVSWLAGDDAGAGAGLAAGAGVALASAARGGTGAGVGGRLGRAIRGGLRDASAARAADAAALARVVAAELGAFSCARDAQGFLCVRYGAPSARGGSQAHTAERHPALPAAALPALLRAAAAEGGAAAGAGLAALQVARASPPLFWALVQAGGVGPGTTVADAAQRLAPERDWGAAQGRKRARPRRYAGGGGGQGGGGDGDG